MKKFTRALKEKKGIILCVVSVVMTIAGTAFAVKAGSDIKEEMEEKKPEKAADKAKIYAKHLWKTALCDALAISANVGCYKDGVRKERIAMELAYGYQAQLMAATQAKINEQIKNTVHIGEDESQMGEDKSPRYIDENTEIMVTIPSAGGQRIKTTLLKITRAQTMVNKILMDDGEIWQDDAVEILGGIRTNSTKFWSLDVARDEPHHENQDVFDYLGNWVDFQLVLDLMTGEYKLHFYNENSDDIYCVQQQY